MYLVIAMDASGREFLLAVFNSRAVAEAKAHYYRRKWTQARVSCAVEGVELLGALVNKWETE